MHMYCTKNVKKSFWSVYIGNNIINCFSSTLTWQTSLNRLFAVSLSKPRSGCNGIRSITRIPNSNTYNNIETNNLWISNTVNNYNCSYLIFIMYLIVLGIVETFFFKIFVQEIIPRVKNYFKWKRNKTNIP